jgi:Bacterial Ig-like domain (group 2)
MPLKLTARFMGVIMNRILTGGVLAAVAIFSSLSCTDTTSPSALGSNDLSADEARVLAAIQVHLAADTIKVGQTTQATDAEQDRRGRPLYRPVLWSTSNSLIATVTDSGVVTAISTGTVNITATRNAVSGSARLTVVAADSIPADTSPPPVNTSPPPSGSSNEPSGMTQLTLREFNSLNELPHWQDDQPGVIYSDPTAPSAPTVWRAVYPTGFAAGAAGTSAWFFMLSNNVHTVYLSWWFRYSSNWYGQSTGTNKQLYVWTNGDHPTMYVFARGSGSGELTPYATVQGSQVPRSDELLLGPNLVPSARIIRGQWQHFELVLVGNTSGTANGSLDLYLDGVHISSYSNMQFITGDALWGDMNLAPVWGGLGGTVPATQTFDVDHFYMSGKH